MLLGRRVRIVSFTRVDKINIKQRGSSSFVLKMGTIREDYYFDKPGPQNTAEVMRARSRSP